MTGELTMFKAFYAAIYDRITSGAERAGLSEERHGLLAQAAGATIEVGAGTGVNLAHFPPAVTRLCLVEPDPSMRKRLHRRASGRDDVQIVDAPAEALPFPDGSFDTAVVTFALCSVADLDSALAEIARVLRPGGRLLFLEHVRDTDPEIARKQDHPGFLYSLMGCHPNRDSLTAISRAPFEVTTVRHGEVPKAPRVERPMIVGAAARCA
jgi:ubiquinone/menaquinone biosynthesis C-methylase UbiE